MNIARITSLDFTSEERSKAYQAYGVDLPVLSARLSFRQDGQGQTGGAPERKNSKCAKRVIRILFKTLLR